MDVAYACREHCHAEVCYPLAFFGVSAFAFADNAVLFAAYGAYFRLEAEAEFRANFNEFLCFFYVFFDGEVRTVEHYRREACLYALVAAVVGAVVKVQGNGNGDVHLFYHGLYHRGNRLEAGHVLARTLGNAEDDGSIQLLRGGEYGLCPLKVVDVELTDCIFALHSLFKHLFC